MGEALWADAPVWIWTSPTGLPQPLHRLCPCVPGHKGKQGWIPAELNPPSHAPWHRFGSTRRKRCLFLTFPNVLCSLTAALFILPPTPQLSKPLKRLVGSYRIFTTPWNRDYEHNFINEKMRLRGGERQNSPRGTTQVPEIPLGPKELGTNQ